MKLIEISQNKHINCDGICSVIISTHSETKSEALGYGQKRTKKVGETSAMTITTADGKEHVVESTFFEDVYNQLFPIGSD
jgi:hypothetical protein